MTISHHAHRLMFAAFVILFVGCEQSGTEQPVQTASIGGSSRLSELLGNQDSAAFPRVLEPRPFEFPRDHGPHPEYRNEWWYVTGNLDGEDQQRYGFELTLFRFALAPEDAAGQQEPSAWQTRQVYVGHFALTDVRSEDFHVAQRFARGALGLAGATASPFRVWLEDWSIGDAPECPADRWCLIAGDDGVELNLEMQPLRKPVLQGKNGFSQKSDEPGNASYYYSIPRLQADGYLQLNGQQVAVSGIAWLDREWGSSALAGDQVGWDWFALQLTDGSDLMFYRLRKVDGTIDHNSAGSLTHPDGEHIALDADSVSIEALRYWESPLGGRYPVSWRMQVDALDLDLTITPVLDAQELFATVRYWEGAVDVDGKSQGQPISGRGYVELTGYSESP